jgi:secondary thiamine-phosphate synthase enzyme
MSFCQKTIILPARSRGSFLITSTIIDALPELRHYRVGLLNLFVQHTSCALSLNENCDPDVRYDMSDALDRIVPEDSEETGLYRHDAEGADDMPVSQWTFIATILNVVELLRRAVVLYWWNYSLFAHARSRLIVWAGAHQKRSDWYEPDDSNLRWKAGHGNMAGHLVS